MRSKTCKLGEGFRIAFDHRGVQAAEMVIAPDDKEGGPDNRHAGADQWLFVVEGSGLAIVEGARRRLQRGSLLLIERGERHEIRNTGRSLLVTVNFYSPSAYTQKGVLKPAGKPAGAARGGGRSPLAAQANA
jgi:mannose-6-phosphate isomerase-like protein (cupin superfamily)